MHYLFLNMKLDRSQEDVVSVVGCEY